MRLPFRHLLVVLSVLLVMAVLAPLSALATHEEGPFPDLIPLPNGFRPEGIEIGRGNTFFVGSIPTGAVYQGDIRTGEGEVFINGEESGAAIGLGYDRRTDFLFVAGGPTGKGFVYDTRDGDLLATFDFASESAPSGTFVNDVVVTRDGAFFTDSFLGVLYRVPLSAGGGLLSSSDFDEIALGSGFPAGAGVFRANGIDATPDGRYLIVVNSTAGTLYRVDVSSGEITQIDLGGATVTMGDGILLEGQTLYVVRNQSNQIAVVRLSPDLRSGEIVNTITDDDFDVPTTVARSGNWLYLPNARFGVASPETQDYDVVRVDKR